MNLAELINKAYEDEENLLKSQEAHIGASITGNQCEALIAFSLRGFPDELGYRLKESLETDTE